MLSIRNGACTTTDTVTVLDVGPSVSIDPHYTEFNPGEAVKLAADAGHVPGLSYTWSPAALVPGTGAQVTLYPTETVYAKVTVANGRGCTASDSALLKKLDRLFIPSAITPETGDQNAFWNIKGAEAYPDMDVRVYNRWGALVHQQRGYTSPWDGTLNGKELPTATYYYVIKAKNLDKTRVGDLTIVR